MSLFCYCYVVYLCFYGELKACVVALQVASVVPMLTIVILIFCICVQLHKLIPMGVFQEDMLKGSYKTWTGMESGIIS